MTSSQVQRAEPVGHELYKLSISGTDWLAIRIAGTNNSRATKQFTEDSQAHGLIVQGNQISHWETKGLIEYDGMIYLYGPYYAGRSVDEILGSASDGGLTYVYQLAKAFTLLKNREMPLPRFQTNSILFLDDGGLLFFPPQIMERMRSTQVELERIRTYEFFNNQELSNEDNLSFALGVLCYRLMTGLLPFPGETAEEIHHRVRELKLVPPHLRVPELREDVSTAVVSSLRKGKTPPLSLSEWEEHLRSWQRDGYVVQIKEDEKDTLIAFGKKMERRYDVRSAG